MQNHHWVHQNGVKVGEDTIRNLGTQWKERKRVTTAKTPVRKPCVFVTGHEDKAGRQRRPRTGQVQSGAPGEDVSYQNSLGIRV